MDKEQKNKLENILFHKHSWSQKDIDDLDMKIEDIIDAYEQTKQFAISNVAGQSEQLCQHENIGAANAEKMYCKDCKKWVDNE